MIFGQDHVFPAMSLVIATTRSSLQASISLACDQFVVFICKGRGAFGRSQRGQLLRVIDLIVDDRGE
jgi:hypothetical protein